MKPLSEYDLGTMEEMDLRALKRERYLAQQALPRTDRDGYLALREEMLLIIAYIDARTLERHEQSYITAAMSPNAVNAQIEAVAAAAYGAGSV